MEDLTEHELTIVREALSLEERDPPSPWRREALLPGGGPAPARDVLACEVHDGFEVLECAGIDRSGDRALYETSSTGLVRTTGISGRH